MSYFHQPPIPSATPNRLLLKPPAPLRSYPICPEDGQVNTLREGNNKPPGSHCALDLLHQIQSLVAQLLEAVPEATCLDTVAGFSGDPCVLTNNPDKAWEVVNGVLHSTLGWNTPVEELVKLIRCGPLGVEGFVSWIKVCVLHMGINGCLLEGRLEWMLEAVKQL